MRSCRLNWTPRVLFMHNSGGRHHSDHLRETGEQELGENFESSQEIKYYLSEIGQAMPRKIYEFPQA